MESTDKLHRLGELTALFLKLGFISFGGPAAHIALMETEVVEKRQWLTHEYFLDLVGATNLIPGPNAAEMAMHVGYVRAGRIGLVVAGAGFILPAALVTAGFAWAYRRFGALPQVSPFLYGIKPAVLAIILAATWRLGKTAIGLRRGGEVQQAALQKRAISLLAIGLAVTLATLLGLNEVVALLLGGVLGMLWLRLLERGKSSGGAAGAAACLVPWWEAVRNRHGRFPQTCYVLPAALAGAGAAGVSLWQLGFFFLKVGAVLYGSGYVLVALLEGGLVHDYGWLTQQQLLDAIAIGQFTPGPVLSTATFIGYLVSGAPGAVVATVAIFLPSFFFVAALNPLVPHLRRSVWTATFLDAVNVSAIALMAAVTVRLGQATLTGWPAWLIALAAAVAGLRWKVNAAWLVLGGAVVGWVLSAMVM